MKKLIYIIWLISTSFIYAGDCDKYYNEFPIKESHLFARESKSNTLLKNEIIAVGDKEIILLTSNQYNRLPVGTVLYNTEGEKIIKTSIDKVEVDGYLELGVDKQRYLEHIKLRDERQFGDKIVIDSWGVDIDKSHTEEGRREMIEYLEGLGEKTWIWFDTETTGLSGLRAQLTEIYAGAGKMKFDRDNQSVSFKNIADAHLRIKLNNHSIQKIIRDIKNPPIDSSRMSLMDLLVMQNYPFVAKSEVLSKKNISLNDLDQEWEGLLESQQTMLDEDEALKILFELFGEFDESVQVAHNLQFDMNMVNARALSFENLDYLGKSNHFLFDTEILVKKYWIPLHQELAAKGEQRSLQILADLTKEGRRGPYISASMGAVTKALGIENDGWHQADTDVRMMIRVFEKIYADLVKSIE